LHQGFVQAFRLTAPHELRLSSVPQPEPGPGEVLVKVGAAALAGLRSDGIAERALNVRVLALLEQRLELREGLAIFAASWCVRAARYAGSGAGEGVTAARGIPAAA